ARALCTTKLPPANTCATVAPGLGFQLLENCSPPLGFQTVKPMVSLDPGSPLSVMVICSVWLPAMEMTLSGLVTSWMTALAVYWAWLAAGPNPIDRMDVVVIWMTCMAPVLGFVWRMMMLAWPWRFDWLGLYLTLKPKLVFVPGSAA